MVFCMEQRADLHTAQLMPLPLTVSCFSKIQIGFTFLVPADLGSPGNRAVKRVCVYDGRPLATLRAIYSPRRPNLTPVYYESRGLWRDAALEWLPVLVSGDGRCPSDTVCPSRCSFLSLFSQSAADVNLPCSRSLRAPATAAACRCLPRPGHTRRLSPTPLHRQSCLPSCHLIGAARIVCGPGSVKRYHRGIS